MKSVLITDDEPSFLLSLQDGLKVHENKFAIVTARNGQEAIERLQQSTIDLLVTDLEMPLMNGFELLAWTSRERPQLPVIVMTAFGTPEIESQLAQYETLQYLEKPLDLKTLEDAILAGLENGTKSFIQGITPAAFLQLLNLEKKSCTLKIRSAEGTGYLYLLEGNLIDAECEGLTGEKAAHQIVCWEKTEIEMDNHCQRLENSIEISLESILLNAHRLKDEVSQQTSLQLGVPAEEGFPSEQIAKIQQAGKEEQVYQPMQSEQVRKLLVNRVFAHKAVTDFALFDKHSMVEKQNPGESNLHTFDPAIYLHLASPLEEKLDFGICKVISFSTARRTPFMLFKLDDYNLLVKLQQGVPSQVVAPEISALIQEILASA